MFAASGKNLQTSLIKIKSVFGSISLFLVFFPIQKLRDERRISESFLPHCEKKERSKERRKANKYKNKENEIFQADFSGKRKEKEIHLRRTSRRKKIGHEVFENENDHKFLVNLRCHKKSLGLRRRKNSFHPIYFLAGSSFPKKSKVQHC